MTQHLENLLTNTDSRLSSLRRIKSAFVSFVGPKTTAELWNIFNQEQFGNFAGDLSVRGSATQMAAELADYIERRPESSITDGLLKLIQQNTEAEIYPDARRDLGIELKEL